MIKKTYSSFEDAIEEEIVIPLNKAHLSVKDYDINAMAEKMITVEGAGFTVYRDKPFWEFVEEFSK